MVFFSSVDRNFSYGVPQSSRLLRPVHDWYFAVELFVRFQLHLDNHEILACLLPLHRHYCVRFGEVG